MSTRSITASIRKGRKHSYRPARWNRQTTRPVRADNMTKFLLWCLLLVLCWPLALLALVIYPVVWIVLLPFRLVGLAVGGVFALLGAIIMFPARVLGGPRAI